MGAECSKVAIDIIEQQKQQQQQQQQQPRTKNDEGGGGGGREEQAPPPTTPGGGSVSSGTTTTKTTTRKKNRSFRGQMMQSHPKNRDVSKHYEIIDQAGEGSMCTTFVVKRMKPTQSWTTTTIFGIHIPTINKRAGGGNNGGFITRRRRRESSMREMVSKDLLKANNKSGGGRLYAMKTINKESDIFLDEMRNEIRILKHFDHPNIVKVYECFERKRAIHLITEYCSGGDLFDRAPYTEEQALRIMRQLLRAVAYMHRKNVVHRDIKFENILFVDNGPELNIKVIDFGLSKKFLMKHQMKMTERVGTVYTMAPQVLQGIYTSKADLWSCGVVAYMLLCGQEPFQGKTRRQRVDKIMRCAYNFNNMAWKSISNDAQNFVSSLLQLNPHKRPTALEALQLHWMTRRHENNPKPHPLNPDEMEEIRRNLVSYASDAKFKRLALMVIAQRSTTEEIVRLRKVFSHYDADNDGIITYSEFKGALMESRYAESELETIFKSLDINETGRIEYTEFLAATIQTQGVIESERLAEAFDRFDLDNTGFITKKNLRELLGPKSTEEMVAQILDELETDRDDEISYEEFLNLFQVRKMEEIEDAQAVLETRSTFDSAHSSSGGDRSSLLDENAYVPGGRHDNEDEEEEFELAQEESARDGGANESNV